MWFSVHNIGDLCTAFEVVSCVVLVEVQNDVWRRRRKAEKELAIADSVVGYVWTNHVWTHHPSNRAETWQNWGQPLPQLWVFTLTLFPKKNDAFVHGNSQFIPFRGKFQADIYTHTHTYMYVREVMLILDESFGQVQEPYAWQNSIVKEACGM